MGGAAGAELRTAPATASLREAADPPTRALKRQPHPPLLPFSQWRINSKGRELDCITRTAVLSG
jgi:hypothetical protein